MAEWAEHLAKWAPRDRATSILAIDVHTEGEPLRIGERLAIIPEVSGRAYITGRNEIFVDPKDPLREGFVLR